MDDLTNESRIHLKFMQCHNQSIENMLSVEEYQDDKTPVTDNYTTIGFNTPEELFDQLRTQLSDTSTYKNPQILGPITQEEPGLLDDVGAYLEIFNEEVKSFQALESRSVTRRLTDMFGLTSKLALPTDAVTQMNAGYENPRTGEIIPTSDPLMAIAVARGHYFTCPLKGNYSRIPAFITDAD